ncbi:bZIP transcription factor [Aspergillus clavatus NRRL 1]|uniref:AT DNA binding protein, putative n=1 Tax=Aspergillus clavatus (strain ATCC 1007 / CBS 513.65 / DSM 816 / NCTC 3887 / NRRL 1 / QM 1276 / 107) TaxID=344612 RepID=A1C7B7_ASPCL|nr:AT DNA binding protein, putative [Aspergillus clavatus NRRL 1]EAW14288.1 AT DNA binding protein, putative [Aspergillus clavatus NRRL 1]
MMPIQDDSDSSKVPGRNLPLLSWEEVHQNLLLSTRRNVSDPLSVQSINSILSATSYPFLTPEESGIPPSSSLQGTQPVWGYTSINEHSSTGQQAKDQNQNASKRPRSRAANADGSFPRKRGRPRKQVDEGEDPNERRRMQIRLAQRAYRLRKDANTSSIQSRVLQLEATLEQIGTALQSISNAMNQPDSLEYNAHLIGGWGDTVRMCLSLVNEAASVESQDLVEGTSPLSEKSHSSAEKNEPQLQTATSMGSPPSRIKSSASAGPESLYAAGFKPTRDGHDSSKVAALEMSAFIERLHFACLHEGYSVLRDASVELDRLQKPFRFLFRTMDRERITSYFEACLHAKASQKRLDEWEDVPYFRIGGAGTHYPGKTPRSSTEVLSRCKNIQDPVLQSPQEIGQKLDGEWFDLHDLEGFLHEQGVVFVVGHAKDSLAGEKSVNAAYLIQGWSIL